MYLLSYGYLCDCFALDSCTRNQPYSELGTRSQYNDRFDIFGSLIVSNTIFEYYRFFMIFQLFLNYFYKNPKIGSNQYR